MGNATESGKIKVVRLLVTSDKMDKSRVGVYERMVKHPGYKKYIKRRTKMMFHDEKNESRTGDVVEITQVRPMSSRKAFSLHRIVSHIESAEV